MSNKKCYDVYVQMTWDYAGGSLEDGTEYMGRTTAASEAQAVRNIKYRLSMDEYGEPRREPYRVAHISRGIEYGCVSYDWYAEEVKA